MNNTRITIVRSADDRGWVYFDPRSQQPRRTSQLMLTDLRGICGFEVSKNHFFYNRQHPFKDAELTFYEEIRNIVEVVSL